MSRMDKENPTLGLGMRVDWEIGDGRHGEGCGTWNPALGTRHIKHRTLNSVSINKFPYWEICITFVNKNSAGYCKKHVKGLLGNPSGL